MICDVLYCFLWTLLLFCAGLLTLLDWTAPCEYPTMLCFQEQKTNLKFLFKSGVKPKDCWCALKDVFGDDTMALSTVQKWHK